MGSEWPDKRTIRLGLAAWRVARGGVGFFPSGHPPQVNSVGSGVVWVMGLFSLWGASFCCMKTLVPEAGIQGMGK